MTKSRAFRLQIVDQKTFVEELQRAIKQRFGGNITKAARAVGLRQPHLYKLQAGDFGELEPQTLPKLMELVVTDEAKKRILFSILSPTASLLLLYYDRWCEARISGRYPRGTRTLVGSARRGALIVPRKDVARRRQTELFELWRRIENSTRFRGHFSALEKAVKQADGDVQRQLVAIWRVFEPLFESRDAGFIEKRWDELSDDDLEKFVKAGVARERILLKRSSRQQRAQEIAQLFETRTIPDGAKLPKAPRRRSR